MYEAKSCFMVYSRREVADFGLQIYGQDIGSKFELKYKGIWFDKRLTWKRHVEHIEMKCRKVLNLMRAVAGYDWGSDRQTLLNMYQALIR